MRTRTALAAAVLLLSAALATGADSPPPGMTTYHFVLLVPGSESRPMGEREIQRLQEGHLAHLERLHEEGTAVISGPLDAGGAIHGVVVLDVASLGEAERIMGEDPWVRAGKLAAEIHPWWAAEGVLREPTDHRHLSTCYLGLLRRPHDPPGYTEDELREIQAGHMANIRKMSDSGDLVLAGPMADDGELRGILIFRTPDPERIRELVAEDPAVKLGRLGMELYRWHVPRGVVPEP